MKKPAEVQGVGGDYAENRNVCFCTLAMGTDYRVYAKILAADIDKYHPGIEFIILTDKPSDFSGCKNVKAFKHKQYNFWVYNDKAFVIEKALSFYQTAIFIDANARIYGASDLNVYWPSGIVAVSCYPCKKHHLKVSKLADGMGLLEPIARKLNIDLDKAMFVHETLFAATRDSGREKDFIRYWRIMADYFALRRIPMSRVSEGTIMGMAGVKANFSIQHYVNHGGQFNNWKFFKDNTVSYKIGKNAKCDSEELLFLEEARKHEFRKRSLIAKVFKRLRAILIRELLFIRVIFRQAARAGIQKNIAGAPIL